MEANSLHRHAMRRKIIQGKGSRVHYNVPCRAGGRPVFALPVIILRRSIDVPGNFDPDAYFNGDINSTFMLCKTQKHIRNAITQFSITFISKFCRPNPHQNFQPDLASSLSQRCPSLSAPFPPPKSIWSLRIDPPLNPRGVILC